MSSFYDRTQYLLTWCKETNKPQKELAEVVERRFDQAKYYFEHLKGELPTCPIHYCLEKFAVEAETDVLGCGEIFMRWLLEETIENLYETHLFQHIQGLFASLHDWGHRVGNAGLGSDNPYSVPKHLDSDVWLREKYGHRNPWR